MHRKQKLLDILIAHIITCVEDMHVKPEHRTDNEYATIPEGETFSETCVRVLETEALNCHYVLTETDKEDILSEIHRVGDRVRV